MGEYVAFADLALTELREERERRVGGTRALNCPNCGAGVEILDPDHALNVVCGSCSSVLDAKSPSLKVLQTFQAKLKVKPLIPMGAKGTWKGEEYRVLGFQQRTLRVEGTDYSWREYLLFSPREGYRYFTEYDGHWNDVIPLKTIPEETQAGGRPVARLHGETFKHFQSADARTTYVLGEFPWEVRIGDTVRTADFVAPPRMLSAETTEEETTWSLGEYTPGDRVWKAFGVEGNPPRPKGVYANQPSPHAGKAGAYWKTFGVLLLLWAVFWIGRAAVGSDELLTRSFSYEPGSEDLAVATTPAFELRGRPSALGVEVETDVANNWVFFNYALLNQETGQAIEFGREVSFYFGRDEGEDWTEGDKKDEARVPSVPPGRYVLRIEPDGPAPVSYTVKVRHDVPSFGFFLVALLVLLVPPVFALMGSAAFETSRWAESDYAPEEDDD